MMLCDYTALMGLRKYFTYYGILKEPLKSALL